MRRQCVGCRKSILAHVWVVRERDFCSPACQRDFDVEPGERVLKFNKKRDRMEPVPARWYDSQQRQERR